MVSPGAQPLPDPPFWTCTIGKGPREPSSGPRLMRTHIGHPGGDHLSTLPPTPPELPLGLVGERRFGRAGALTQSSAAPCTLSASGPHEGLGPAWQSPRHPHTEGFAWPHRGKGRRERCPGLRLQWEACLEEGSGSAGHWRTSGK